MSFVVGMHSRMHYLEYPTYDIAYYAFNSIFTPAIPLFYMVSGYLLLGRDNSDYDYVLKKIYGILRFTTIITLSFSLLTFVVRCQFDIKQLIVNVCLWPIQRGVMGIFWYFGAMIVLYLCYPILNKLYIQKRIKKVLIFSLIISFVGSYLNLFTTSWGGGRNEDTTMFKALDHNNLFHTRRMYKKNESYKDNMGFISCFFTINDDTAINNGTIYRESLS